MIINPRTFYNLLSRNNIIKKDAKRFRCGRDVHEVVSAVPRGAQPRMRRRPAHSRTTILLETIVFFQTGRHDLAEETLKYSLRVDRRNADRVLIIVAESM